MRIFPLCAAALVAALSGCATESYILRTPALRVADSQKLVDGLKKFDGVAEVRLTSTRDIAFVSTRARTPLSESAVVSSMKSLGIEVSSFEHPEWAKLPVYVINASGGG
ncbi:MAG: hypothetical protein ACKVX7_04245 [Planctomycetota bacterium]